MWIWSFLGLVLIKYNYIYLVSLYVHLHRWHFIYCKREIYQHLVMVSKYLLPSTISWTKTFECWTQKQTDATGFTKLKLLIFTKLNQKKLWKLIFVLYESQQRAAETVWWGKYKIVNDWAAFCLTISQR